MEISRTNNCSLIFFLAMAGDLQALQNQLSEADLLALLIENPVFEEQTIDKARYTLSSNGSVQARVSWLIWTMEATGRWRIDDGELCILMEEDDGADEEFCGIMTHLEGARYRFDELNGEQTMLLRVSN